MKFMSYTTYRLKLYIHNYLDDNSDTDFVEILILACFDIIICRYVSTLIPING